MSDSSALTITRIPLGERRLLLLGNIPAEEVLRAEACGDDLRIAGGFASEHRRREFLAWRTMVRREVGGGAQIEYDEWGAPRLGGGMHIGVSHSRDCVAVILADTPCAVDVEHPGRDFARVAERYLTPHERTLSQHPDFPAAAWCAKEALYKYNRRRATDLLRDIRIESVAGDLTQICGSVGGRRLHLQVMRHEGNLVVFIV